MSRQVRNAVPWNFLGYSFIVKGSGEGTAGGKTTFFKE